MSTATIVWIAVVVVIVAAVAVLLVVRTNRRRAQASHRMGLPDLGALSAEGLDQKASSEPTAADSASGHRPER